MLTPDQAVSLALTDHVGYPDYLATTILDALAAAGFAVVARDEYMKMAVRLATQTEEVPS